MATPEREGAVSYWFRSRRCPVCEGVGFVKFHSHTGESADVPVAVIRQVKEEGESVSPKNDFGISNKGASRSDNPEAWVSGRHEKFETPLRPTDEGSAPANVGHVCHKGAGVG